jgi:hypothetical protein
LASLEERLLRKIEKQENGCWIWQGHINKKGYGRIKLSEHSYRAAHRAAYELWVAPIPEGLQVLHVCGNSTCCNPDHLAVVAVSESAALRTRYSKRVKGQSVTPSPPAPRPRTSVAHVRGIYASSQNTVLGAPDKPYWAKACI